MRWFTAPRAADRLDLSMSQGKLIGSMMAALTEFERDLLRKRIRSGVAAARTRGVVFPLQLGQRVKATLPRKLQTRIHNVALRLVQPRESLQRYRSQYPGRFVALMGAFLLATLPAEANSAALEKLKDNAPRENSPTAANGQTVVVV